MSDPYQTCLEGIIRVFQNCDVFVAKVRQSDTSAAKIDVLIASLEQSVDHALKELPDYKHAESGQAGDDLEEFDANTLITLQQITIELQSSLLQCVTNAAFKRNAESSDLADLVLMTESCRTRTADIFRTLRRASVSVTLLAERPLMIKTASDSSTPFSLPRSTRSSQPGTPDTSIGQQSEKSRHSVSSLAHPRKQSKTWTRPEYVVDGTESPALETTASPVDERRKRGFSMFAPFHRHHHHHRNQSVQHSKPSLFSHSDLESISDKRPSSPTGSSLSATDLMSKRLSVQQHEGFLKHHAWDENHLDGWSIGRPSLDRHDTTVAPDVLDPTAFLSSSPVVLHRTISGLQTQNFIHTPTPENEFLGFCKGAWKLQTGDRKGAVTKCREADAWSRHASSVSNTLQYLTCATNRCLFRSHFSHPDVEFIWKKVFFDRSKGIKYRWSFLAKSHVLQRNVIRHEYAFQCLFCAFLGSAGKSNVYTGIPLYLDHISKEHRGASLSEVLLYRTSCINDHEASDAEAFDINILPLTAEEHEQRQSSAASPVSTGKSQLKASNMDWMSNEFTFAEPSYKRISESRDSVLNGMHGGNVNEPWNTGLSDFHYRGVYDRVDL